MSFQIKFFKFLYQVMKYLIWNFGLMRINRFASVCVPKGQIYAPILFKTRVDSTYTFWLLIGQA